LKPTLAPRDLGLVQVYTGTGKGKTSAAIGAGVRAIGHGLTVHMIQFLKGEGGLALSGEIRTLKLIPQFTVEQFGPCHLLRSNTITEGDRRSVNRGMDRTREVLAEGHYDLVILDEINVILQLGFVPLADVLLALQEKASRTEVILTGRGAPKQLINHADLVSRIEAVKHPFVDRGLQARRGIEF